MPQKNQNYSLETSFQNFIRGVRRKLRIPASPPSIDPQLQSVCERVRKEEITYLSMQRLRSIVWLMEDINKRGIAGDLIEAGCALGGSAIVLTASKGIERKLSIYDTFEMIPPPGPKDGPDVHRRYEKIAKGEAKGISGEDDYYGYRDDIPDQVRASFESYGFPVDESGVTMVKGLVEDTLAVDGPICFAHVDVDWYSPVTCCLERIVPHLSVGGAVVLDDYLDWSGCNEAANDFFNSPIKNQFSFHARYGHLVIRRTKAS